MSEEGGQAEIEFVHLMTEDVPVEFNKTIKGETRPLCQFIDNTVAQPAGSLDGHGATQSLYLGKGIEI